MCMTCMHNIIDAVCYRKHFVCGSTCYNKTKQMKRIAFIKLGNMDNRGHFRLYKDKINVQILKLKC